LLSQVKIVKGLEKIDDFKMKADLRALVTDIDGIGPENNERVLRRVELEIFLFFFKVSAFQLKTLKLYLL